MRSKKYRKKNLFLFSIVGVVVLTRGVPGEPLLVELDHGLGAFDVGHTRGDQVRLVRPFPLDEEHELAGEVNGADDALRVQAAVKASVRSTGIPLSVRVQGVRDHGAVQWVGLIGSDAGVDARRRS